MGHARKEDIELARELKIGLGQKMGIRDFRLFGSRARGTSDRDSDMDIYIEVESLTREQRRLINDVAWQVGLTKDVVIAPVVVTSERLHRSPFKATTLYRAIVEEGMEL